MNPPMRIRWAAVLLVALLLPARGDAAVTAFPIPYRQSAVLFPPDDSAMQAFGAAITAQGDTAAIGAPGRLGENDFPDGAVDVYQRGPAGWSQVAQLGPPAGLQWTWFGQTLALDGDTLAVGAPLADVGVDGEPGYLENTGAVYVFTGGGAAWQQQGAALMPAQLTAGNNLGMALDLNGDTLIAATDDHGGFNDAVYIYGRVSENWIQQARLANPDADDTSFGTAVTVVGDLALVAAPGHFGSSAPGVVYVYARDGGDWSAAGMLTPDDAAPGDSFGCALDFDGATAVVTACAFAEPETPDRAYVFAYDDGPWIQQARLDPLTGGASVDLLSVDLTDDRIVLGAAEQFYQGVASIGSSYLFERDGDIWSQTQELRPDDVEWADGHVWDVALAGQDVLTGAIWKSRLNVAQTGAVYVFSPRLPESGLAFLPVAARGPLDQSTGLMAYITAAPGSDTELVLATSGGRGQVNLSNSPWSELSPAWSPDGERLALIRESPGLLQLVVADRDGGSEIVIPTPGANAIHRPAWSPDGRFIAYDGLRGADFDVFVVAVAGGEPVNLTQTAQASESHPVWSPDGERIAFRDGNTLATMKPDGSDIRPVAGAMAGAFPTDWSPDGSAILYFRLYDGPPDLYTIPAAGGEPQLVIESGRDGRWSPDGRQIVFTGAGGGIFQVDAGGGNLRVVVSSKFAQMPDWQP